MLKKHFEDILECENLPYPEKGSGANGRVLVVDLATAVVNGVLADLDEETRKTVLASLTRTKTAEEFEFEEDENLPMELLKVVTNLDIENKEQFRKVTEAASRLLEKRMEHEKEEEIKKRVRKAKEDMEEETQKKNQEARGGKSIKQKSKARSFHPHHFPATRIYQQVANTNSF